MFSHGLEALPPATAPDFNLCNRWKSVDPPM